MPWIPRRVVGWTRRTARRALYAARRRKARLAVAVASGVWAWMLLREAAVALAVAAGVTAGLEWAVLAALVVWIVDSALAGSLLSHAVAVLASGIALVAMARLTREGLPPKPRFSVHGVGFIVAAVVVAGAVLAFGVQLYAYMLSRIDSLPLNMYEVMAPLKETFAGRLVTATLVVAAAAYSSYKITDALVVSTIDRESSRKLLALEAADDAGYLALAKDYPTKLLGEAFVGIAALVYAPVARYLVDTVREAVAPLGGEVFNAIAPLIYYAMAWLALRVMLRGLLQPAVETPPRAREAAAPLLLALAVIAALSIVNPQFRVEALAAVGLQGRGSLLPLDEEAFNREYLSFMETIVSIIEFAVRFFWSG